MSFLSIPSAEGLFTTVKTRKSSGGAEGRSAMDDEDRNGDEDEDDEDEDDDDTESVHIIPRCSPVPRKRGASIYDETAEYMRIHLALSAAKKVSFADTTGGDLVDVKEFVAFDSDDDDEEASARWEEEEAKYRAPQREPTYQVLPEFHAPSEAALLQAVHANKLEVEGVSPVENEPLAFTGVVRVLNISFHKAVYIRSTMDSWATYFDHPAEYLQGSHDGTTDQFSFKLSFAPPYITHGSRIEFVVRYETSDGDFWANNSSMNYVVTLLLSYEDDSAQANVDVQEMKSILKPPKDYSMNDDFDSEDEHEKEEAEAAGTSTSGLVRPTPVCPVAMEPEIDIEIAAHPSGPSVPPNQELPSVDGTPSSRTVSPGEQFPCMSSETTPQTNSSFVLCASESVQPNKSQPLPRLHCELGNQTSEQGIDTSPSAPPPAPTPSLLRELRPTSDSTQAGGEEILLSEGSIMHPPTAETDMQPATGEDESTDSPASPPCLVELPADSETQGSELDVSPGLSKPEGLSEASTTSAAHREDNTPACSSAVVESQEEEGEAPPSPGLTESPSVSTGVAEVSRTSAPQSVPAREEEKDGPQTAPDTSLENPPNTTPEVSELQSERDVSRNLMPPVVFLSGVVSLSIVLQNPSALFVIGLLAVLHRL